jgi:hypothetical protein
MKAIHRTTIATYVASQRHLRGGLRGAKTLTQMADEIGTTKSTVRRWLRRDHWPLWMENWASAEDMWEASRQNRERLPQRERQAKQIAEERHRKALLADLDRSLVGLKSGVNLDATATSASDVPHGTSPTIGWPLCLLSCHRYSLRGGVPYLPFLGDHRSSSSRLQAPG